MSLVTCQNIQTGEVRTIATENASTACGRIQVQDSGKIFNYPPIYRRLEGEELARLSALKEELSKYEQLTNNKASYDYQWAVDEVNAKLQIEEEFIERAPRLLKSSNLKPEHREEIEMLYGMLIAGQDINKMRARVLEIKAELLAIGTEYRVGLKKKDREAGARAMLEQEKARIDMQAELQAYAQAKTEPSAEPIVVLQDDEPKRARKKKKSDDSDPGDQGS